MTFNLDNASSFNADADSSPRRGQHIIPTFPPWFKPWFKPNMWKIAYGGRGSGKTKSCCRALLLMGLQKPLRILCAREFMASIQDSVWQQLVDEIEELKLGDFYEVEKASIRSKQPVTDPNDPDAKKYTSFRFQGIRTNISQIKSFANIDICFCEEAANISDRSWEILIPTIHRKGQTLDRPEIWVIFNPEFEEDATFQRFCVSPPTNALISKVNYYDNPYFPVGLQEAMEELKLRDYEAFKHVYLGECRAYLDGAVYRNEIKDAEEQEQFTKVAYDPLGGPVEAAWDLGIGDATAIWIFQKVGREIHLIDYHEGESIPVVKWLTVLNDKTRHPYPIERHILPHDSRAREKSTGMSIESLVRRKGYKVYVCPNLPVSTGVDVVRELFSCMYFDKLKCADGIKALRNYRYEVIRDLDRQNTRFRNQPEHDKFSHAADALRYLALSLRPKRDRGPLNTRENVHSSASSNSWMATI